MCDYREKLKEVWVKESVMDEIKEAMEILGDLFEDIKA